MLQSVSGASRPFLAVRLHILKGSQRPKSRQSQTPGNPRQIASQVVSDAVGKVLLVRILREVLKGQDDDRQPWLATWGNSIELKVASMKRSPCTAERWVFPKQCLVRIIPTSHIAACRAAPLCSPALGAFARDSVFLRVLCG